MLMDIIKARHSIRKYTDEQISSVCGKIIIKHQDEKGIIYGLTDMFKEDAAGGGACFCNSRQ